MVSIFFTSRYKKIYSKKKNKEEKQKAMDSTRASLLKEFDSARWNQNADAIVALLSSSRMHHLTAQDLRDLECNLCMRAANDRFSHDLERLQVQKSLLGFLSKTSK